jgi:hypothetical protein
VSAAVIKKLEPIIGRVKTITFDNRSFSTQDVKSFESSAVHHSFKTSDTMNRLGAVTSSNNPRKAINNIIGDEINYLAKLPDESL